MKDLVTSLASLDAQFMPDTAGIVRTSPGTVNPDGSGSDGTTTTTTYPCRFVSGTALEAIFGARMTQEADAVVYLPLGTDALVTDTVSYAGNTYQIIGSNASASYATSLALILRLVK